MEMMMSDDEDDLTLAYLWGRKDAEDVIKRLRAENERLREALRQIANYHPSITHGWAEDVRLIARSALYDQVIGEDA